MFYSYSEHFAGQSLGFRVDTIRICIWSIIDAIHHGIDYYLSMKQLPVSIEVNLNSTSLTSCVGRSVFFSPVPSSPSPHTSPPPSNNSITSADSLPERSDSIPSIPLAESLEVDLPSGGVSMDGHGGQRKPISDHGQDNQVDSNQRSDVVVDLVEQITHSSQSKTGIHYIYIHYIHTYIHT